VITDHLPEQWLPVPGWESLYEVSDMGQVRSLPRQTVKGIRGGQILKAVIARGRCRYPTVRLSRSGCHENRTVHSLVLAAFAGPCPEGHVSRHGPGGPADARLSNLSYGTPAENSADMARDGTVQHGERNPAARLTAAVVAEIRLLAAAGAIQRDLARTYGISPATVCLIVNWRTWRFPPAS
jgi:NUMOD4 motif/HNH endonuclease